MLTCAPSYLLPGAAGVAAAQLQQQALVPQDQDLLGSLGGLAVPGQGVPVVRGALQAHTEHMECGCWCEPGKTAI